MIDGVRAQVALLRAKVSTVIVRCEPHAVFAVDGVEIGRTPLRRPLLLDPGTHRLTAARGKESFSMVLQLSAGERREGDAVLSPGKAALSPLPPRPDVAGPGTTPPRRRRIWTWVTAGGAVAAAVVAIAVGVSARSDHDEFMTTNDPKRFYELESTINDKVRATNAMWGVAGAAAVASLVLFFVEGRPARDIQKATKTTSASGLRLAPDVRRSAGGFLLQTSF